MTARSSRMSMGVGTCRCCRDYAESDIIEDGLPTLGRLA